MINDRYEVIDMSHRILFPMLFNLHAHLGESIFRRITGNNWSITKYLSYTSEYNSRYSKEDLEKLWTNSAIYTMKKMLNNGINGFCAARSAPIHEKLCMDTMAGYPIMNSEKLKRFQDGGIEKFDCYYQKYNNKKCSVGIFFHSLYMTEVSSLKFAKECMEHGAEFISIHLSEDCITREKEVKKYGKEPVFVLDAYGLLNEKTILVHCGFVSDDELDIISRRGACVAICPLSNKFLNTIVINPKRLNQYGIRWSICTDGLATGRSLSLQDQMLYFKSLYPEISNEQLLSSVTLIPAALYGRKHYTGTIKVGMPALFNQLYYDEESIQNVLQSFVTNIHRWPVLDFQR